ncbi:metal-dependent hydrolase [bacterium]|nr:metal-dependent hydrolase [bacterium]
MPTIFTHAVVGISSGITADKKTEKVKFLMLSVICSILPDADLLGFKLGISYGDFLGHRGFVHSIFFAVVLGMFISTFFYKVNKRFSKNWWYYTIYFTAVTSSHGILDAFTNGGLGIALLAPFDNRRYFFWATPITVSPLNPKYFFTLHGLKIMLNEVVIVWIPFLLFAAITRWLRRKPGKSLTNS